MQWFSAQRILSDAGTIYVGTIHMQYAWSDNSSSMKHLLQHFPMYRTSDSNCSGPDAAPPKDRYKKFKQKYDCLSQESSNKVSLQQEYYTNLY